jgi:hypothetical protein
VVGMLGRGEGLKAPEPECYNLVCDWESYLL